MTDDDSQPTEQQFMDRLEWLVGLMEEFEVQYGSRSLVTFGRPGSELQEDDAALGGYALSYRVGNCLMIALDQLRAARSLLKPQPADPVRVPFIGPYPNLRAAFEASCLAIWLLAPDAAPVRQARALATDWDATAQNVRLVKRQCLVRNGDDATTRSKKTREQAEAMAEIDSHRNPLLDKVSALGLDAGIVREGIPAFVDFVEAAAEGEKFPAHMFSFVWQTMSGMAHPSFARNAHLAPQVSTADSGELHSHEPRAELRFLGSSIDMMLMLLAKALKLAARRALQPDLQFLRSPDAPDDPTGR